MAMVCTKRRASVIRMKGRNGKFQRSSKPKKKQEPIWKGSSHTFRSTDLPIMMRAKREGER